MEQGRAPEALVDIRELRKGYPVRGGFPGRHGTVRAVDGVSLRIRRGETLGLVGESGCGKSTLGRLLLRLEEPTAGRILFEGEDISSLGGASLHAYRRRVQIIFQDPYSSLNPRMSAGAIIGEPLAVHGTPAAEIPGEVERLAETVGLSREQTTRYPHEFSGGQRQRIGIARALALRPDLVVADEPVSALDVSIQAQILNLLKDLQERMGLTYLFITHDFGVVRFMSDRIAVMYLGRIVELVENADLDRHPLHPYTEALLSAVPATDTASRRTRIVLPGDPPSAVDPPPGCVFHPRCPRRMEVCRRDVPALADRENGHPTACHLYATVDGEPSL
ncbi:MAG: ATP-binding cassette domain-containing protein [Syntrophaceae bacterium]|nr:ATP-binding cassette domain-containing protein [Syntrophaceae bacterium]